MFLAGAVLLVAGCNKQGLYPRHKAGEEVKFGIYAYPETRTVYGADKEVDGKTVQAIDWVATDAIRIYSPQAACPTPRDGFHWADYIVTPTEGDASKGTISHEEGQGNGLAWSETDEHSFYAIYPSPSADDAEGLTDGTTGKFTCLIPNQQAFSETGNMHYAYMTAVAKDGAGITEDAVTLDFHPDFTAFEIKVRSAGNAIGLSKFELISEDGTALHGEYTVNLEGTQKYTCPAASTDPSVISMNLTGQTAGVGEEGELTFTVLALPQEFGKLRVKFTTSEGNSRSLALKYSESATQHTPNTYITFAPGKKHRIYGLALPNGELLISVGTAPWEDGGETTYTTIENVTTSFVSIRRVDDDNDFSTWDIPGTRIAIAPGVVETEEIEGVEITTNRPLYAARFDLATVSVGVPLKLHSSNPKIGFVTMTGGVYTATPVQDLEIRASADLDDEVLTTYYVVPAADATVGDMADITLLRTDLNVPIAYSHQDLPGSYDHTKVPFKVVSPADFQDNTKTQEILPQI